MFKILNRRNISTIFTPSTVSACVLREMGLLQLSVKEKQRSKTGCLVKHHPSLSFNLIPHVGKPVGTLKFKYYTFIIPELPLSSYLIDLHVVHISLIIGKGQIKNDVF